MTIDTSQPSAGGRPPLSKRECVMLAAIGGLAISAATYPTMQGGYTDLLLRADPAEWTGFVLRILLGVALGGFWGYLQRPEHDRLRAFQVGLVAPATLAGMIYANGEVADSQEAAEAAMRGAVHATSAAPLVLVGGRDGAPGLWGQNNPPAPKPEPFIDRLLKGALGK